MEDLKKSFLVKGDNIVGALGDKYFTNTPLGTVLSFAGQTAPHGYLLCDGASYKVADYEDLYTVIGNTYGGDTENFNVPDYRETVLVGVGENTTDAIASHDVYELGEFKDDQLQGHWHNLGNINGTRTEALGAAVIGGGTNGTAIDYNTQRYVVNAALDAVTDGTNGTPRVENTTHGKQKGVIYIIKAFHTNEGTDDGVVEQIEQINNITNQLSNPNLLDNPDFSINQRGLTEYQVSSKAYTVDRWKTANVPALIIPGDKQITIQRHPSQSSSFSSLGQIVEKLSKGTYTFSIDIISADESVPTIVMRAMDWADIANGVSGTYYAIKSIDNSTNSAVGRHSLTFTLPEDKENVYIYIYGSNLATEDAKFTIANAKLEVGSIATPYVAPHPAEELAKCQRYYQIIPSFCMLCACNSTNLYFINNLPTTLRSIPSIDGDISWKLYKISANTIVVESATSTDWSVKINSINSKSEVMLVLTKSGHGITGDHYLYISTGGLSADL